MNAYFVVGWDFLSLICLLIHIYFHVTRQLSVVTQSRPAQSEILV